MSDAREKIIEAMAYAGCSAYWEYMSSPNGSCICERTKEPACYGWLEISACALAAAEKMGVKVPSIDSDDFDADDDRCFECGATRACYSCASSGGWLSKAEYEEQERLAAISP